MPNATFVPSLTGEQLGGPDSDLVIVEWTDSDVSGATVRSATGVSSSIGSDPNAGNSLQETTDR
jgi:hypothetical protein